MQENTNTGSTPTASAPTSPEDETLPVLAIGSWTSRRTSERPAISTTTMRSDSYGREMELAGLPDLDPGLTVLLAPTRWGKTTLVEEFLLPQLGDANVLYQQILEPSSFHPTARRHTSVSAALAEAARFVRDVPDAIWVGDSLRFGVYGPAAGGTGEGGLNLFIAVQLTALHNVLLEHGARALLTINPMTPTEDEAARRRYALLVEMLQSSCSLWHAQLDAAFTITASLRGPQRTDRSAVSYEVPRLESSRRAAVSPPGLGTGPDVEIALPLGHTGSARAARAVTGAFGRESAFHTQR